MPALGPASVRAACSSRSSGRGAFSHVLSPFFNLFSPDNLTFGAPVGEITGHVLVQCWGRNASVPRHHVLDLTCGAAEVGPGSPEPARVKGRQWRPFRPPCRGLRHEQRCPGEGGRIRGFDQRRESGGVAAGRGGAVGGHRLPGQRRQPSLGREMGGVQPAGLLVVRPPGGCPARLWFFSSELPLQLPSFAGSLLFFRNCFRVSEHRARK